MEHEENRAIVQRYVAADDRVRRLVGAGPPLDMEALRAAFKELAEATAAWRRYLGLET